MATIRQPLPFTADSAATIRIRSSLSLRRLPMVLSFMLLAFQVILPWTAHHFVTQDGPSHIYNALATEAVLLHPSSPYAGLYAIQAKLIPNWTTTVLLVAASKIAGPDHAEQLLASGVLLALYFAFAYAARSVSARASGYTPVTNFLVHTWFLQMGFYNFQLGMALGLFLIGFYLRRRQNWTPALSGWMAAAIVLLFFTHLVPAGLVCITAAITEGWIFLMERRRYQRADWRRIALIGIALLPAPLLVAGFVRGNESGDPVPVEAKESLKSFPRQLFSLSLGRSGRQDVLYPAVLAYLGVTLLILRRREWRSVPGAILIAALISFALYLYLPDSGMGGGGHVKVRFAWAAFLFAGILAASIRRAQSFQLPVSIYVAILLTVDLLTVMHANARASRMVDAYTAAADVMPPGSRFVRLRYPAYQTLGRYRLDGVPVDPMFHIDALAAARRGHLDVSNYEALTGHFPLRLRPSVPIEDQWRIWALDAAEQNAVPWMQSMEKSNPLPVDYALVLGDAPNPEALSLLATRATLVSTAGSPPFLRVYRWKQATSLPAHRQ